MLCDLGANPDAICPMHECGDEACEAAERPLLIHAADGHGVDAARKTSILLEAGADCLATDGDGYTALEHVVSRLCADGAADDAMHTARYENFHEGLAALPDPLSRWTDRRAFVDEARPLVRAYVERFAGAIPVPETCSFDADWRRERIETIVTLVVWQAWTGSAGDGGA